MKRIGIIGGTSWSATAAYYKRLNVQVQSLLGGNHSADLILRSLDFQTLLDRLDKPQKIEEAFYRAAGDLISGGAELIALASLTAHRYAGRLRNLAAPMRGIDSAISDALDEMRIGIVGVMTTSVATEDESLMSRLEGAMERQLVLPTTDRMAQLDAIIFRELAHTRLSERSRETLETIAEKLVDQGAEAILLGTTEFSSFVDRMHFSVPVVDAVEVHCRDLVANSF